MTSVLAALMSMLIYLYRERTWSGFEMFGVLFHALKMQHLSEQGEEEVSMEDFYKGGVMPPEVATIKIKLQKSARYEMSGQPTNIGTDQFPGRDKAKNEELVDKLQRGDILLNGLSEPARRWDRNAGALPLRVAQRQPADAGHP